MEIDTECYGISEFGMSNHLKLELGQGCATHLLLYNTSFQN